MYLFIIMKEKKAVLFLIPGNISIEEQLREKMSVKETFVT